MPETHLKENVKPIRNNTGVFLLLHEELIPKQIRIAQYEERRI